MDASSNLIEKNLLRSMPRSTLVLSRKIPSQNVDVQCQFYRFSMIIFSGIEFIARSEETEVKHAAPR